MSDHIDLRQLAARESEQVEWKANVADIDDVVETLSAFANDLANLGGGYVVCGASETKDEHGFPFMELTGLTSGRLKEIEGTVLTRCRDRVSPPLAPLVEELPAATPDRRILVFIVAATDQAHLFRRGAQGAKYFVRIGRETREARDGTLRELLIRKGALEPWDRQPCAAAIPTVLRTMRQEGCPPPVFETNDARVVCTLPAHPRHAAALAALERDRWKGRLFEIISHGRPEGTPFETLSRAFPDARRDDLRVLLRELRKAGHIHVRGATKAARWFPGSEPS